MNLLKWIWDHESKSLKPSATTTTVLGADNLQPTDAATPVASTETAAAQPPSELVQAHAKLTEIEQAAERFLGTRASQIKALVAEVRTLL